jgi:hypothetical protein
VGDDAAKSQRPRHRNANTSDIVHLINLFTVL